MNVVEYVKTKNLRPGDVLVRTLYDDKGRVLLRYGKELTDRYIDLISLHGYKGTYVYKEKNENNFLTQVTEPLLDDAFTMQIISRIKDLTNCKQTGFDPNDAVFTAFRKKMDETVEEIVDALFEAEKEEKLVFETEDLRTNKTWIYFHCLNTCVIAAGIAIKLGLSKQEVLEIALGGMYHDIGKMFIKRELVAKKDVTDQEKKEIRNHCAIGFKLFQQLRYPIGVTYAIWFHHEREDGSGYPNGVSGEKIPLSAKIVGLASTYDNMVNYNPISDKIYSQNEAIERILADQKFNVDVVRAFTEFVMPYPIGTKVLLSNGSTATVINNKAGFPLRPCVIVDNAIVDLTDSECLSLTIVETIEN